MRRGGPIRDQKRGKGKTATGDLRAAAFERARGCCEKCGDALPESWALHHRLMKSHGGRDELPNVLALHHKCHNLGTDSVHLRPAVAYEHGWLVRSYADPATSPVAVAGKGLVYLLPTGGYSATCPDEMSA